MHMQALRGWSGRRLFAVRARVFTLLGLAFALLFAPATATAQSAPLNVVFTATPSQAMPGDTVVYRVVISNPSSSTPTPTLSARIAIPQYVTTTYLPNGNCQGSCRFGGFAAWSVGAIAPGASTVLQATVVVDNSETNPPPSAGTVIAASLETTIGSTTLTNIASFTIGPRPMSLVVSGAPDRVEAGGLLTYTLSYGNPGSSARSALLTMPIPSGTTFVSATGGGVGSGGNVQWDLGSVPAGFADRRQVTVRVGDSAVAGSLLFANPELVDSSTTALYAEDSTTSLVATSSLLAFSLSATPNPAAAGGAIEYTLRIANRSATTATGAFQVWVNVPKHTTATYVVNGNCGHSCRFGGVLYWTVGSIPAGDSTIVQFTTTVDNSESEPPPPKGSVLAVQATAFVYGGVSAREAVVVGDGSRLKLAVSETPDRVTPGGSLTYTLSYGNAGTAATPALLRLPIPTGTTFVSATGGGTSDGSSVSWDLGSVAAGYADRRQVTLKVDDAAVPGTLVDARPELVAPGSLQRLVRATATSLVANNSLLAMSLISTPNPAAAGGAISYTVRLANRSTNTPTGSFQVWVRVPEGTTATYVTNGNCGHSCRFGGVLYWTVGSIAPGETTRLNFTLVVDNSTANPPPPIGSVLTTTAHAFVFGGLEARDTLTIGTGSRLELELADSPDRVAPGSLLAYTLTYGNAGTGTTPALLRLPIPTGTTFVSATGGGTSDGTTVSWDLGNVASGFADRRQVTLRVDDAAVPGSLVEARPELVAPGTLQSLVRRTATSVVSESALLSMSLGTTPNPVTPGSAIVNTIRLANRSTNTPTGSFQVWVNVPEFTTATYVPGGNCGHTCRFGGLLYWTVASIAPGESTLLQYTLVVDNSEEYPAPPAGTVLATTAHAFQFGGLEAHDVSIVGTGGQLNLAIGGAPDRVAPGSNLTYTLEYSNAGGASAPARLRLPLPKDTSFVSASGDGTLTDGTVEWDLGTLDNGETGAQTLVVRAGDGALDGTLLEAQAELRSGSDGRTLVRETTSSLVQSSSLLGMALSATPDPVLPGNALVYRIDLANHSTNTPTGSFQVWAHLPPNVLATSVPGGNCGHTCRFGGLLYWTVGSIAAGGNAVLNFTVTVDNSVANPPPPAGTLLETQATAFVFGGVRAFTTVHAGGTPSGSGGAGGAGGTGGSAGSAGTGTGAGGSTSAGGASSGSGGVSGSGTATGGTSGSGGTTGGSAGSLSAGGTSGTDGSGGTTLPGGGGEGGEAGAGTGGESGAPSEGGTAGDEPSGSGGSASGAAGESNGSAGEAGAASEAGAGGQADPGEGGADGAGRAGTAGRAGSSAGGSAGSSSGGSAGSGGSGAAEPEKDSGCGCKVVGKRENDSGLALLGLLAGLTVLRRRRVRPAT